METVNQRAIKYGEKLISERYRAERENITNAYIRGALEQQEIDIRKAQDAHCSLCPSLSLCHYANGDCRYGCIQRELISQYFNRPLNSSMPKLVQPYQAVDLGLSVKWANMNVGATAPEESGKYFAWGDTTGATANEISDKFNNSWYSGTGLTAITTNLTLEQDAAHVNMGGDWRMPTRKEMEELISLKSEWTCVNGVFGRKFYGIGDKSANSIFVPAAGYCYGGGRGNVGASGYYWTSSLGRSSSACGLDFGSGYVDVGDYYRYYGRSVRAVCA